jgi:hypothetical protein
MARRSLKSRGSGGRSLSTAGATSTLGFSKKRSCVPIFSTYFTHFPFLNGLECNKTRLGERATERTRRDPAIVVPVMAKVALRIVKQFVISAFVALRQRRVFSALLSGIAAPRTMRSSPDRRSNSPPFRPADRVSPHSEGIRSLARLSELVFSGVDETSDVFKTPLVDTTVRSDRTSSRIPQCTQFARAKRHGEPL